MASPGSRDTMPPATERSEAALLDAARCGDEDAFRRLTEAYSRELHLHCYRMMGSLHDAEDLVQETFLRAWRGLDGFQGRSSLRAWLYRVATNACLSALERGRREPVVIARRNGNGAHADAVPQLEPYPDALLDRLDHVQDSRATPEARYELRESVSLAFQVAIQLLPPRQRAALILGDVLGFSARESAGLMGSTVAAVNSALQRARAAVQQNGAAGGSSASIVGQVEQRRLVERFVDAWERHDVDGLVRLLTDRAVLTMPPDPLCLVGRPAIAAFFTTGPAAGCLERTRLVLTGANGQPAFASYQLDAATGVYLAHAIAVLTVEGPAVGALTAFLDPSLFPFFGLPGSLDR